MTLNLPTASENQTETQDTDTFLQFFGEIFEQILSLYIHPLSGAHEISGE